MNQHEYRAFSDALQRTLERDSRVIGLMATGSMACQSHQPDEWSDHDVWVTVEAGALEWFCTHREWLPDSEQIVLLVREAEGSFKAIYRNGHLVEYTVTDHQDLLRYARVNDYRILIDRVGLAADVAQLQQATTAEANSAADDLCLLGQFLTNLLVGVGRYKRGERLSARQLITVSSLYALLQLIPRRLPPEKPGVLDNLDPLRRVELAYPETGAEINRLLWLDLNRAALALLDLADCLLRDRVPDYPAEAVSIIRGRISL